MAASAAKPRLAVWKFASCDGCQLSLLDCEDELLAVAGAVEIAYFLEATSVQGRGPYDLSLVEGAISTPADAERIKAIRRASRVLITIGACATAGGIQALRNFPGGETFLPTVYPHPEHVETLTTATPIADHVPVDFEQRGCPIDKRQLLEVVGAVLNRRKPAIPTGSVCMECKCRGTPCLLVARGIPCMGPVTQAGCGALCPALGRGCFGCFGPMETPNTAALATVWRGHGAGHRELLRAFRGFTGYAEAFRTESQAHEHADSHDQG